MLSSIPRYAPQLVPLDGEVNIVPTSIESVTYQFMSRDVAPEQLPTLMAIESVSYQVMTKEAPVEPISTAVGIESIYFQYMVRE